MGILSWWKRNNNKDPTNQQQKQLSASTSNLTKPEAPGMNGAVEVTRASQPTPLPEEGVTVFEFGSVAASADKVTLSGFCPVSDDLQPCRWEILPASDDHSPQFRVLF